MSVEDNFDIDIYGDEAAAPEEGQGEDQTGDAAGATVADESGAHESAHDQNVRQMQHLMQTEQDAPTQGSVGADPGAEAEDTIYGEADMGSYQVSGGNTNDGSQPEVKQESQLRQNSSTPTVATSQGVKRKEGPDDRAVDPFASNALVISDLPWWINDDDLRGWANKSNCEEELRDLTFSEHKVHGKSKGQAYLEFETPQAATAVKLTIEKLAEEKPVAKKYTVAFHTSGPNPFKSLPKDAPARQNDRRPDRASNRGDGNYAGSFRGNRGGSRGGIGFRAGFQGAQQMGGMPAGGFNQPQMAAASGAGFPMGGMGFNNFNRGGMMMNGGGAMRGGRGRGGMMMPTMPMGNMAMGGMGGMGMNMGMNMGGMPGFGAAPQAHFNPAFFAGQQQQMNGSGGGDWNPHGNKRHRPD